MPDTTVTVTAGMPTTVTVTGGVADVTVDVQRGIPGPNTITTATTTDLVGFLSGDGATVTASTSATFITGSEASFDINSRANFNSGSQADFISGSAVNFGDFSQANFDNDSQATFFSGSQATFFSGTIKLAGTHTSSLNFVDPTSAKTLTFPDATGTVALTDDPRFTDARTPLAHTHVSSDIVSIASQRLIGRHAGGAGAGQEVQVGDGIEFQGSGIRRSALTGDITASAGSNATTLAATIAGAKTLSGQLQLTGQSATDASSAMTLGLGDARYFLHSTNFITANQTKANNADFAGATALTTIPRITCAFLPSSIRVRACIMFTTAPVAFTTANFNFILFSTNIGNSNMSTGTPLTIVPTSVSKVSGLEQYIIIAEVSAADIATKYGSAFSTFGVLSFFNGCDLKNKTGASLTTVATNAGFIALEIYR